MCFSIPNFSIIVPPITASIKPTTTYAIAILAPKKDISKSKDAISTIGEDIKKENVTPIGNPAEVKPINIGILEQLQKGVTVPNNAPNIFPFIPLNPPSIFLVFLEENNFEYKIL